MDNQNDRYQALIPTKNVPALLSYYFGVFGLIPLAGIPLSITAIVLGIIGLGKYKQNPTPGAKAHALVGLILGILEIIGIMVFFILMTIKLN